MPLRYSIDKQRRLVVTVADGCVTFAEILDHRDRLLADPDFDSNFDQLIDATTATKLDIMPAEARGLSERRVVSPDSRRALVATLPHVYGLGRMMMIHHLDRGNAAVEVFHSMGEALKWLGREAETA